MIAHAFEWRGDIFEDSLSIVVDGGGLAMHETRGAVHFATIDRAEALVPEADPKHRDFSGKVFDGFGRDAPILDRFAWARRDDEVIRLEGDQLIQGDLVVAKDANLRAEL